MLHPVPYGATINAQQNDHLADWIIYHHDIAEAEDGHNKGHMHRVEVQKLFNVEDTTRVVDDTRGVELYVVIANGAVLRRVLECENVTLRDDETYPVTTTTSRLRTRRDGGLIADQYHHFVKLAYACDAMRVDHGCVVGKNMRAVWFVRARDAEAMRRADECARWAHFFRANKAALTPCATPELRPNMVAQTRNPRVAKIKKGIAHECEELTLVKHIGVKERNRAIDAGFARWSDPGVTASMLGLDPASKRGRLVDVILAANRGPPEEFDPNRTPKAVQEGDAFIDLETSCLYEGVTNYVFMIGVGYGAMEFEIFVVEQPTASEECRIVDEACARLRELNVRRILHWGAHERIVFAQIDARRDTKYAEQFEFVDMCARVEAIGFCPKGALNLSLKSVAPAMHALGMIATIWDSSCQDGESAMQEAYTAYMTGDSSVIDDVARYNKVDVIVTMEIWCFLAGTGRLL